MSESENMNRRSLTPCLDENRVDDENCADDSKEIELSDISDDEDNEEWSECNTKNENLRANGKSNQTNREFAFKKMTKNNRRDRNYRDNLSKRNNSATAAPDEYHSSRMSYKKYDNSRRKEIERYDVRKVVASIREFTMSRSRSRSFSPRTKQDNAPEQRHQRASFSPSNTQRESFKRSITPVASHPSRRKRYSPALSPRPHHQHKHRHHSLSPSPQRHFRKFPFKRSITPEKVPRRSRSRHRHTKSIAN
jgi:hypothetical protein